LTCVGIVVLEHLRAMLPWRYYSPTASLCLQTEGGEA